MTEQKTVYRKDYKPYTHNIESVRLDFDLSPEHTVVTNCMTVVPVSSRRGHDLVLDGRNITFEKLVIDGEEADSSRYQLTDTQLVIKGIDCRTQITVTNTFNAAANTDLSGIYISNGAFMSQCEAQGFRRITYWPDRPDVLSKFTVTIHADKEDYPVLLSNGNLTDSGDEGEGRHFVRFEDPFNKPSYLFALVAGNFVAREETIILANGKNCLLQVWTEPKNFDKSAWALESLKRAIRWDEQRFNLELDLDRFMIVATDDFNFGAMENKGLNIFNSRYVMARPDMATDADYLAIESVVGHEYFHNWTGDRVTVRDWFQLTLKEGLTVFRDQEFSMDVAGSESAAAVKRIKDVRALRAAQFPEDAGPMAHPIRPDSYQEINNFYTMTVYEKGAEVIRMLQTILGREGFKNGMDTYIARHDGKAVTCDDFIAAMAEANTVDLTAFSRWWGQAGTPRVTIETAWDEASRTYTVYASQSTPPTPGEPTKHPLVIPVTVGLISRQTGRDLELRLAGTDAAPATSHTLILDSENDSWTFENVAEMPVISVGRGFSAPVIFDCHYDREELAFLASHDSDPFNRAEAFHRLACIVINEVADMLECGTRVEPHESIFTAFGAILNDDALAPLYRATALELPSERIVSMQRAMINPDAVRYARQIVTEAIGKRFSQDLNRHIISNAIFDSGYRPVAEDIGKRAIKNLCLSYWLHGGAAKALLTARDQFDNADNLTDKLAALAMIVASKSPAKQDVLFAAGRDWAAEPLLFNKWLTVQATAPCHPGEVPVVERVRTLATCSNFSMANPNNVYALVNAFCSNNDAEFHRIDGSGYKYWSEIVLMLDKINTHVAARIARALDNWRRFDPVRAGMMNAELKRVAAEPELSSAVREIVQKALCNN